MPVLSLSPQQVMGSRCTTGVPHDWMATKALIRWQSGERWIGVLDWSLACVIGRWCWNRDWFWSVVGFGVSLVLDYRRFWIIVVVCLYYQLTDFTLHLLFLSTTLTFTTRFPAR